jgi:hypothetical protein
MRHQDALMTVAIAQHVDISPTRTCAEFPYGVTVLPSDFDEQQPTRSQASFRSRDDRSHELQPVGTAAQRACGFELTDVSVEFRVLSIRHVRWIRNDEVESFVLAHRSVQITHTKVDVCPETGRVPLRELHSFRDDVGCNHRRNSVGGNTRSRRRCVSFRSDNIAQRRLRRANVDLRSDVTHNRNCCRLLHSLQLRRLIESARSAANRPAPGTVGPTNRAHS